MLIKKFHKVRNFSPIVKFVQFVRNNYGTNEFILCLLACQKPREETEMWTFSFSELFGKIGRVDRGGYSPINPL